MPSLDAEVNSGRVPYLRCVIPNLLQPVTDLARISSALNVAMPSNLPVLALVVQALLCFFPLIDRRPP